MRIFRYLFVTCYSSKASRQDVEVVFQLPSIAQCITFWVCQLLQRFYQPFEAQMFA